MLYIKEFLNKIKWDKNLNKEDFVIHYLDNVSKQLVPLNFNDIIRIEGTFMVVDKDTEETHIPLHRIKKVYEKGIVVWKR